MWCGLGTHYNEKHRGRPTPAATHSPPAQNNKEQRATQIHTGVQEQTDTRTNTNCATNTYTHTLLLCDVMQYPYPRGLTPSLTEYPTPHETSNPTIPLGEVRS